MRAASLGLVGGAVADSQVVPQLKGHLNVSLEVNHEQLEEAYLVHLGHVRRRVGVVAVVVVHRRYYMQNDQHGKGRLPVLQEVLTIKLKVL